MKVKQFKITVAIPSDTPEVFVHDLYDVLWRNGQARTDLQQCAWEIEEEEN